MALFIALAVAVVALAHTAPFPFLLEAFAPRQSIWRVAPQPGGPPAVYLTFDDGPNLDWTPPPPSS
jgi:peptidoglycan/xylan/chitin deacetylase (PgdA/CDA1 family)